MSLNSILSAFHEYEKGIVIFMINCFSFDSVHKHIAKHHVHSIGIVTSKDQDHMVDRQTN